MPNPVLLDSNQHRDLRVITDRGARFGENVHLVPVIADELSSLVLDYPVCLLKDDDTGQFGLYALMGFEPGENLFLSGEHWLAAHVPLHVQRQPFLVGYAADGDSGSATDDAVITIDLESKRVSRTEGEALFSADGSRTEFLVGIDNLLSRLMNGINATDVFVRELAEHDLVELARVEITFVDGQQRSYEGLYTINAQNLGDLGGELLEDFHRKGYLQACFLLVASMGQLPKLVARKNAALTGDA